MNHIILEGFMGSGKGTVGKKLAAELGLPLIDTDKMIADRMKMTPGEIYDRFGDVYYRALETFVLSELAENTERSVIVVGSGLPVMPQNESYLRDMGRVFYLKSDEAVMLAKLERSKRRDWLAEDDNLRDRAKKMLAEREPYYRAAATDEVFVGRKNASEVTAEIIEMLKDEPVGKPEAKPEEKPAKPAKTKKAAKKKAEKEAPEKAETAAEAKPEAGPGAEEKPVEKKKTVKKKASKTEEAEPAKKKTVRKKAAKTAEKE